VVLLFQVKLCEAIGVQEDATRTRSSAMSDELFQKAKASSTVDAGHYVYTAPRMFAYTNRVCLGAHPVSRAQPKIKLSSRDAFMIIIFASLALPG
jgi:hypothetical protein